MKKFFLVKNEKENEKIQKKLFSLGYGWKVYGRVYFLNVFGFPVYIVLCDKKCIKYTYKYERGFCEIEL